MCCIGGVVGHGQDGSRLFVCGRNALSLIHHEEEE